MSQPIDEASSNAAPSSSPQETRQDREQPNINFAFLVHSRDTFNLPPSVDNKSLARQRRKRTSPEDQAILEAEFQRDPKPDKVRRLDIVNRVALGDKEVQIWFQNRRQSKRRKSLPPLSYEILPRLESAHPRPPTASDGASDASSSQEPASSHEHVFQVATPIASQASFTSVNSAPTTIGHERESPDGRASDSQASSISTSPNVQSQTDTTPTEGQANPSSQSAPQPFAPRFQSTKLSTDITPILEEPPSKLRLSMTSDGGARIISGKEATPSPPRSQPLAPTPFATRQTLRRSYSNVSGREMGERPRSLSRLLERKPSGRSRDSRAWEFWCDSEARNELIVKAHKDTTGSAADAIKLIRSNSASRRFPHPASTRRQSEASSSRESQQTPSDKSSNGESDKENQLPTDEQMTEGGKLKTWSHPVDSSRRRPVLGESRTMPALHSGRVGLGIKDANRSVRQDLSVGPGEGNRDNGRGNISDEDDDEVERFMGGGASSDAYTKKSTFVEKSADERNDEMDCAAGLLSLSQGNWR